MVVLPLRATFPLNVVLVKEAVVNPLLKVTLPELPKVVAPLRVAVVLTVIGFVNCTVLLYSTCVLKVAEAPPKVVFPLKVTAGVKVIAVVPGKDTAPLKVALLALVKFTVLLADNVVVTIPALKVHSELIVCGPDGNGGKPAITFPYPSKPNH